MELSTNTFSARNEVKSLVQVLLDDGLDALDSNSISPSLRRWLIERIPNGKSLLAVAVASCQGTELEQPLADKIGSLPKFALNHGLNTRLRLLKDPEAGCPR